MQDKTKSWAPLSGVKVLEYGTGVAAAYCAKLLKQLGAEVVKIRNPFEPPINADVELRRRAESLFLDADKQWLDQELGSPDFLRRLATTDVVVPAFRPRAASALSLRPQH